MTSSSLRPILLCGTIMAGALFAGTAMSQVSQAEAERLGRDLTPIGAERAGNADGTIPEWTGGLSEPPANIGFQPGGHRPNPFPDDEVLFTIDNSNYRDHAHDLTPGQIAMFENYSTYTMPVYQSRRTCAYPQHVYDATRRNATRARLTDDGNGVIDAVIGFPFPFPTEGVHLIWNHNLRYRGYMATRQFANLAPMPNGTFSPVTVQDQAIFLYSNPNLERLEDINNVSLKYLQSVIAPARRAGSIILVHETINQAVRQRDAWQYSPGTRRVRRAPTIAYDNPQTYSDGQTTSDNFDMYNGAPDRYRWVLHGKEERYIAYNTYRIASPDVRYSDIAQAGHINQDLNRYERHRVWKVEGTLREGARHVYQRRVKWFDEDSYFMAMGDLYDSRGEMWRFQEGLTINYYDGPLCFSAGEIVYDLTNRRYSIQGLTAQEPPINLRANLSEDEFDPSALRRMGTR
jgi:hypothetical protein